jgi:hypothetical protein
MKNKNIDHLIAALTINGLVKQAEENEGTSTGKNLAVASSFIPASFLGDHLGNKLVNRLYTKKLEKIGPLESMFAQDFRPNSAFEQFFNKRIPKEPIAHYEKSLWNKAVNPKKFKLHHGLGGLGGGLGLGILTVLGMKKILENEKN